MDITRRAISSKRITFATLVIILVGGFSAFTSLPQAEDPGFTIRTAVIITVFPGANPERVEMLVTDKIEKRMQQIPELKTVRSES